MPNKHNSAGRKSNPPTTPSQQATDAPEQNQNAERKQQTINDCFSIINTLKPRFEAQGFTETDIWTALLKDYKVNSRQDLTEIEWVALHKRLTEAHRDDHMFGILCKTVKLVIGSCRAYRLNPDLTYVKVYDGIITADIEERCQRHADATGCIVRLHGADKSDGIKEFDPAELKLDSNSPPIAENNDRPARAFEITTKDNETHYIQIIPLPDTPKLDAWARAYASDKDVEVIITTRDNVVINRYKPQYRLYAKPPNGEYELIEVFEELPEDYTTQFEDKADESGQRLKLVRPNGTSSEYVSVGKAQRQRWRDNPPTMTGCRSCGSVSCNGYGGDGFPCKRKG